MYYHPPLDRSMSLLNQHSYSHVIRIYQPSFCRAGRQVKIALWCQQEKSSNEQLNKFPINRRLCLTHIQLAAHKRFYLFFLASPQQTKAIPNIVVRRLGAASAAQLTTAPSEDRALNHVEEPSPDDLPRSELEQTRFTNHFRFPRKQAKVSLGKRDSIVAPNPSGRDLGTCRQETEEREQG